MLDPDPILEEWIKKYLPCSKTNKNDVRLRQRMILETKCYFITFYISQNKNNSESTHLAFQYKENNMEFI